MANHSSHASLPYPIKNARFTVQIPFLDADGDPSDPTTPDTEISKDGGAFADCAEEVTTITGSNGVGYITLTGAETDCVMAALAAKVASGPKATLLTLNPRTLPVIEQGTAQAGAASTITLASGAAAYSLVGCFVRTTGGTGGGGTGGANNQARLITIYDASTKVATVTPAWETNPASDTTYDILLPDGERLFSRVGSFVADSINAAAIAAAAIDEATFAADTAKYQAKIHIFDDNGGSNDRYIVTWYKNGEPILSGITSPTIQVIKASDGTDLIASTALTEIGSTGLYKKDEATNRIVNGAAYIVKVQATIASGTRVWTQPVGRDS